MIAASALVADGVFKADDLARQLVDLSSEIAGPREGIETAFLDVGTRLGQASTLLNRIVAAFAALPRDLDSAEMAEAILRLGNIARRTREIADAFAIEQADIHRLVTAVDAATHPIVDLRRSVRMMGILAINARIVAAGLNEAADHFEVFTMDIANLSDGAKRAVSEFADGHGKLVSAVHGAAAQFGQFEAAHHDDLADLVVRLEQGLADVAGRREASASRSAETVRVSKEISMRVASAVMALQVGDATRQRVQHTETALTDLAAWITGASVGDIAVPETAHNSLAALILELQEGQLKATIDAFGDDIVEAERALVELATDAGGGIADCRKLYGSAEVQGHSSLAVLGAEMQRAALLLRDCATERSHLDLMAGAVDQTVEVLLAHVESVQQIEANMRLVGLNASVKCAQLGPRGASLSVIAEQLRELTAELVPAARTAVARLEEATVAARAFSAASTGTLGQEIGRLEADAMASIRLLETVDQRLTDALLTLDRDGPAATTELAEASRGLSDHASIVELLADAQLRLSELSATAGQGGAPAAEACAPALQLLRRRYSMEAERRVHDQALAGRLSGGASAEPPELPAASAPAADLADVVMFF